MYSRFLGMLSRLALCFLACGLASTVSAQTFYLVDSGDTIHRATSAGLSNFATAPSGATLGGMIIDSKDHVLATDSTNGAVYSFDPTGALTNFATGLMTPTDIAIDSEGNVYVADAGADTVVKYEPNGGTGTTYASGLLMPEAITFGPDDTLYIAESGNGSANTGRISVLPAGSSTLSHLATGLNRPATITLNPSATEVFVGLNMGTSISGYKIADGSADTTYSGITFSGYTSDVTFDSAGNLYVLEGEGDATTHTDIVKVAPDLTVSGYSGEVTGDTEVYGFVLAPNPIISSASSAIAQVGQAFNYQIVATQSPTTYTATGLPGGLSVDGATGVISGTPTTVGSSTVAISAANADASSAAILALTVLPADPAITSPLALSAGLGQPFSYQIAASNEPTSYSASGLPTGLTANSSSGAISGTPTEEGDFSVMLGATNAGGAGSATLALTVRPVVTLAATIPQVTVGSDHSGEFTLSLSQAVTHNLTVSVHISGSAIDGVDYLTVGANKKVHAGKAAKRIEITPQGDLGGESKKAVRLQVLPAADNSYFLDPDGSEKAKVRILAP